MHELFLTTFVSGAELDFYLRVMQGVCSMQPNHTYRRQVIFEGPRSRQLQGINFNSLSPVVPQNRDDWKNLHEQLSRQSFYLTAFWEAPLQSFGIDGTEENAGSGADRAKVDSIPGTIKWTDLPDPSNATKMNRRHVIQLPGEFNIAKNMGAINYRLCGENVRECYQFVRDNVVVEFVRYLKFPGNNQNPVPRITPLPPLKDLVPVDGPEDKWIVTTYRQVLNGNDQDLMKEGVTELAAFKQTLDGCLDFAEVDRHDLDTRVR